MKDRLENYTRQGEEGNEKNRGNGSMDAGGDLGSVAKGSTIGGWRLLALVQLAAVFSFPFSPCHVQFSSLHCKMAFHLPWYADHLH